jgi:gamma-glutamyltranspeptidase / glutathione hydrolase
MIRRAATISLVVTSCTRPQPPTAAPALGPTPQAPVAISARDMVVSVSTDANAIGLAVLAAGGNAVDAAIAVGFAGAVALPGAGNIGGGGFMVIRFPDGRATTIDFREMAPAAATPEMFLDSRGAYSAELHTRSHRSVGVPGTVAGFALAHAKYGRLPWARLVDPAVRLASDGYVAQPQFTRRLGELVTDPRAMPATVAAYSKNGVPYAVGERIRLPDLARTLARIRDRGRDGFYHGETARLVADYMRRNTGLITEADLAAYEAKERAPVRGTYRGYEIISMGPPASGGVAIIEALNILEWYDLSSMRRDSPRHVHLVAEALRRAFVDRARWLGDPDAAAVPVERLTSKAHAARQRVTIREDRATPSEPAQIAERAEGFETTHYSVLDGDGLAVAVTYTLGATFGLGAVVPGAGFLLNNEMYDFNAKPGLTDTTGRIGTTANIARPHRRMLSNQAPTIVAKDGQLVLVTGCNGGRTIPSSVLQVILNVVDHRMPVAAAVAARRVHHQWLPDVLQYETGALSAETVAALERMGHRPRRGLFVGAANTIFVDPRTGARVGVADVRAPDTDASRR